MYIIDRLYTSLERPSGILDPFRKFKSAYIPILERITMTLTFAVFKQWAEWLFIEYNTYFWTYAYIPNCL